MKRLAIILCLAMWLGNSGIQTHAWQGRFASDAPVWKSDVDAAPTPVLAAALGPELPFRFQPIVNAQGQPGGEVWGVLRDQRGFMWFGTLDGLLRYDGYEIKAFRANKTDPTSLSENTIRTIYEDRAGVLWIGTWSGGLNRFERSTETFTHFRHDADDPNSLSSDSVFAILEARDGTLWLGTRGGGLNRFNPATGVFSHYRHDPRQPASLGNDNVFALWEDDGGDLWVGTDGGLDRLNVADGTFSHYRHDADDPDSLSNDVIRALFEDSGGNLWVGTWGGGLNRLDRKTGAFRHYRKQADNAQSLSSDAVFSIRQDAQGALWIGTYGDGLNRFDLHSETFQRFEPGGKEPWQLNAIQIFAIAEAAGTLWLATNTGVFLLDLQPKPFFTFQHDPDNANSLAANEIGAVYEDPHGGLWVATADTGLNRIDRMTGEVSHWQSDPAGVGAFDIWRIAPARDSKLWLATFGGGLIKFDPAGGPPTRYQHNPADPASVGSNLITYVLEEQSGAVWVGTWDAGLDRYDPATNTFSHFAHDPTDQTSLSDNAVMTLVEDQNSELWVGTVAGLNRFDRATGTFTRYQGVPGIAGGLPFDLITSILPDGDTALWVGMWGGGLVHLQLATGEAAVYNHEQGLPSDAVFGILRDDNGMLWLSTSNGLSRFDPRSETFRNYDVQDGLASNVFEASTATRSSSGELFFGTTAGLLTFYPDQIHDRVIVPPIVITELLLANKPVAIGENSVLQQAIAETDALVLSYRDRVISLQIAALAYLSPQKNRYRYKLEGFDGAWTEVSSDRRLVTYTNLDPGDYVFRVTGSNADGVWNEEGASLAISITPPWWETRWFRLAALLLALGLIAGGFAWQRSDALRRQHKMEAMVVERTRELRDARHQISTLFDNSPLGISLTKPDGNILGVNQAMQQITGYSQEELLQTNVNALYTTPGDRVQILEQLNADGVVRNFSVQAQRRDGSHYHASLNLSWLELAGQKVLLGIVDDVTNQIKTNEILSALHQISYDLASIADLPALIEYVITHLRAIVDFQHAALMLAEDDGDSMTVYGYLAPLPPPAFITRQVAANTWSSLSDVLYGDETIYRANLQAAAVPAVLETIQNEQWAAALQESRSWLGVPLLAGDRFIGLLNLLHNEADHYGASDIRLARTFANQVAVSIDNIRLNEQARLTAAADERSRIARELHDSVTQTLFTAGVLAEVTPRIWHKDQNVARQNMEKLNVLIRGALAEMRSLLLEMRSGPQTTQTLDQLLNTLAEATRARAEIAVTTHIVDERQLPADVTLALYRISQEALNNIAKHAEATEVDVVLSNLAERLELVIKDDGRGFDPQHIAAGHLGLNIMAERARKIGAALQVDSAAGQGTKIRVIWPSPKEEEHDE